jgi:hypothetical protein
VLGNPGLHEQASLGNRNPQSIRNRMKAQFANIPATTQQTIIRAMLLKDLQPARDEGIKLGGVLLVSPEMVRLEIERRLGRVNHWSLLPILFR